MNTRSKTKGSVSTSTEKSQMTSDSAASHDQEQSIRQAREQIEREEEFIKQNPPSKAGTNEVHDASVEGEFLRSSYH
ncbi:hypothetical protein K7432_004378 [Basidiobolus ranarum]|uniref:Uncharacterized protein n=1 Tax=Basidiobolus ranarum TaxID=34480 RepID=A0ABR2WYF3_9FUNG